MCDELASGSGMRIFAIPSLAGVALVVIILEDGCPLPIPVSDFAHLSPSLNGERESFLTYLAEHGVAVNSDSKAELGRLVTEAQAKLPSAPT